MKLKLLCLSLLVSSFAFANWQQELVTKYPDLAALAMGKVSPACANLSVYNYVLEGSFDDLQLKKLSIMDMNLTGGITTLFEIEPNTMFRHLVNRDPDTGFTNEGLVLRLDDKGILVQATYNRTNPTRKVELCSSK